MLQIIGCFSYQRLLFLAEDIAGSGSPLELCAYLGSLLEKNYQLAKKGEKWSIGTKDENMIRVPTLG